MIFFVLYRNFPHQNCLTERVCYNFRQNASKVRKLFFFVTSYFFISLFFGFNERLFYFDIMQPVYCVKSESLTIGLSLFLFGIEN